MRANAHIRTIMKKALTTVCILLVAMLLCTVLVACDDTNNPDPDNKPDYEKATYTVTFNTNSDFVLTDSVIKNVPSGSKISAPKDSSGKLIIPVKKGYTFKYWSSDGVNEFNFSTDTIKKNTTITAVYTNNVYKHEPVINAKLNYIKNADGTYSYEIVENAYDGASLSAVELNPETTSIKSTYAGSVTEIACPTPKEGDTFRFWFYMQDGKPVQFTKWAADGASSVAMLSKYYFTKGLTLYAMYESTLPKMKVEYKDSLSELVYTDATKEYSSNSQINEKDAYVATKPGYRFDKWYYTVVGDDDKATDYDFKFYTDKESGTIINSATGTTDFFTPSTLVLKAKWIKQITITSADEYKSKLYNVLRKENPTEDEQLAISQILEADIIIANDVNFGGIGALEPLFDSEHVFKGTIDGGNYDGNGNLTGKSKLQNVSVSAQSHASVFGYVAGSIKNLDVENVNLTVVKDANGKFGIKSVLAPVATRNEGSITNVAVSGAIFNLESGMNTVYIGGIVGENKGFSTKSNTGYISDCTSNVTINDATAKAFVIGGVTAETNASSALTRNSAVVAVKNISTVDDGISANGATYFVLGGIAGRSGGTVTKSNASVTVENGTISSGAASIGGIAGDGTGSLATSSANITVSALVANANVGGLIGKNEGYVLNAYAIVDFDLTAAGKNAILSVGGLIGNNFSSKTETGTSQTIGIGAINKSYSDGEINVAVNDGALTTLFVGGIAGRNNKSKIGGVFTLVDITVDGVKDGVKSNLGFAFGSMEAKATINSGWYGDGNTLTLNGEKYELKFDGNDAEGNPTYTENFEITKVGTKTESSNFTSKVWLESKSNANLDGEVWNLSDGALPTLK